MAAADDVRVVNQGDQLIVWAAFETVVAELMILVHWMLLDAGNCGLSISFAKVHIDTDPSIDGRHA